MTEITEAVERIKTAAADKDYNIIMPIAEAKALLSELTRLQEEVKGLRSKADKGKVYVTVSGLTGTGKSAVLGEIEIAMKAIGLEVETDQALQTEKNMTGADWLDALELYKPVVVLREVNIP